MESKKIFEEIKKSMGDFPPFYPEYRNKKCTNCYAHALGLHWPDEKHEHYIPGKFFFTLTLVLLLDGIL